MTIESKTYTVKTARTELHVTRIEPYFAELPRTTKAVLQALYRHEELVPWL